jgi:hypothetical protein
VLCAECREALLSQGTLSGPGDEETLKVRVSPILRDALTSVGVAEDLDEALLRALKKQHPEQAAELLSAFTRVLEVESNRAHESKPEAARRLAESDPGPEIVLRTSRGEPRRSAAETRVYRIGGKEYHSLEEMPPNVRSIVEQGMRGAPSPSRVGCSWALVGGWLLSLLRALGR